MGWDRNILLTLTDEELLAKTIVAEADSESRKGQLAVAHVIMNRVHAERTKQFGKGIKGVITKAWQFSCWNDNNLVAQHYAQRMFRVNRTNKTYDYWIDNIKDVIDGNTEDPTHGALYYFNPKLARPSWAKKFRHLCTIGNHTFYTDV
jgi:spore germination cell wall hydrolase CwlJ-like protein